MNWIEEFDTEKEKPLDRFVNGISNTAIFRRIAFIGDSLSSGEIEVVDSDGKHRFYDFYEYSWGQYIARKNGIKAYNFSKGGMSAKHYMEVFADQNDLWDPEKACQAYVLALGLNDLNEKASCPVPVGSLQDVDVVDYKNNKPTFMGFYASIISRYKEIQPEAKFFLVTFPHTDGDEAHQQKTKKHSKALYELAQVFENTYVIDLYQYGPYYDSEFKKRFFLNGHMNASGYIFTANMIDAYIDYLIRHNPHEFLYVPLIGNIKF